MQYLLLSNSTMPGQAYFDWPKKHVVTFLGKELKRLIFIPYAGVSISYDDYFASVKQSFEAIGHQLLSIHLAKDKKQMIDHCEGIVVGGGNTFHLLNELYKNDLMEVIIKRIHDGIPYIGWSAGSNIASPTIKTTNDMPIVEPPTFKALNFVSFQINPHYTEKTIEGHGGESRDQRILEFLEVNRESKVLGLPEGMYIQLKNNVLEIGGTGNAKLFKWNKKPVDVPIGNSINRLINS